MMTNSVGAFDLFNPTEEHAQLRSMLRSFVESEVDPQALQFNKQEKFNYPLFKRLGELGVLGVTVNLLSCMWLHIVMLILLHVT